MGVRVRREILATAAVFSKICNRSFSVTQKRATVTRSSTSIKLSAPLRCVIATFVCLQCVNWTPSRHYHGSMHPPALLCCLCTERNCTPYKKDTSVIPEPVELVLLNTFVVSFLLVILQGNWRYEYDCFIIL